VTGDDREDGIRARLAEIGGDDPDPAERALVARLLTSFATGTPVAVEELAEAVERGDVPEVQARAHRLKGSAGNLGAVTLADLFAQVEERARRGEPDDAGTLDRIRAEIAALGPVLARLADMSMGSPKNGR
jgi:HPt (histidine-containing phosphotransfer) domain-containing protein